MIDYDDIILWLIFSILVLIFFIPIFCISIIGGSQGIHTGYITASEINNDLLWTTKVVYIKTDLSSSQEDAYCIIDDNVFKEIKERQKNKNLTTIHFQNNFFVYKWECGKGISIIRDVE